MYIICVAVAPLKSDTDYILDGAYWNVFKSEAIEFRCKHSKCIRDEISWVHTLGLNADLKAPNL